MGRENGDATVASSSIALLQERFRELQRIREKRQERELLKLFSSESERTSGTSSNSRISNYTPGMHFEHNQLSFQPEMILPSNRAPALQDSLLSLRLNSQSNNQAALNNNNNNNNNPSSLWPNATTTTSGSSSRTYFENSDVDTSLHL